MEGVEAGRQALADDSTAGPLLGAEADQEGFGGVWGACQRIPGRSDRAGQGEAVVSWDGVEWSRSGSQTKAEAGAQRRNME